MRPSSSLARPSRLSRPARPAGGRGRRRPLLVACAAAGAIAVVLPAGAASADRVAAVVGEPVTFAFIGDVPYGTNELANFSVLSNAVNADPDVRFVAHSGDIKDGSTQCSDQIFQTTFDSFQQFDDPFWYTPGDNEWTDCHRVNNGSYLPTERLAAIRSLFFPVPGQTTGGTTMPVVSQASSTDPALQPYVENTLFTESCVTFGTIHVVGSNDNGDPWTGLAGGDRPADRTAEFTARRAASVAWVDSVFDTAVAADSEGVFLMMQAEPTTAAAFSAVRAEILSRAAAFAKPVILAHGDAHVYTVTPNYGGVANLTRLENPGATALNKWIKVTATCGSVGVFAQAQQTIAVTPPPVVPEAPVAVLLPVSGAAVAGLWLFLARRRRSAFIA